MISPSAVVHHLWVSGVLCASVFVCFSCNFSFISLEQLKRAVICTFAKLKLLTNVSQLPSQAVPYDYARRGVFT